MFTIFNRIDFSWKLILFTIISTVVVAVSIAIPAHTVGKNLIYGATERQVAIIRDAKKIEIQDYFENKIRDIKTFRKSITAVEGFKDIKKGFEKQIQILGSVEKTKDNYRKVYIFNNPYSKSAKQNFLEGDNTEYSKAHAIYAPYISNIIKERGYYDAFLVDAKTGNIIYTVAKEDDYMTSLMDGSYKDSNLGKLFRAIINSPDGGQEPLLSDYEPYSPSNNEVNCFIGAGIFIEGKLEGVLIFQLKLEEISAKIQRNLLESKKEVPYLVGTDFLLRTDYEEKPKESLILKRKVDSESVKKALAGETGVVVVESGIHGKKAFSGYSQISFLGTKYALIIDMDYAEAVDDLNQFQAKILIVTIIVLIIMILLSYLLTRSLSVPIKESVNVISTSINQISSVVDNHERTTSMQSASVNETTTTLSNISSSTKISADESQIATEKAKNAEELSSKGHESVVEMMNSIQELKKKVSDIAEQILRLSEKNSQISSIISLVSELANETNMLALNAAVEAARAGENGKGFEVVAVEIRKLADESKKSALKIQEIVSEIKNATDTTVIVTEEGVKQADASARLGNKVLDSLSGITNSVGVVFDSIEKISVNIRQQSISISEIVSAMNSINRGSQETATGTTQTKSGIDQIVVATKKLKKLVEGMKE
ncbi:MAG: methyl-accepting chemotaxis protein [Leptospiraceae bacterium]|nr:methyl-accepting chemotaxis protein [Leptospiraceae bacterium]